MIYLFIFLTCFVYFGIAAALFEYVLHKGDQEQERLRRNDEEIKAEAIRRECKRVRRFLEADGETVNRQAVQAYLRRSERQQRKAAEFIAFELIE